MYIISEYVLRENPQKGFFYRSLEEFICPVCGHRKRTVIGSRKRSFLDRAGSRKVLRIRRLKCNSCHKIHHELPDCLIPYKRHCSFTIEAAQKDPETLGADVEQSTLYKWKKWAQRLGTRFLGVLESLRLQAGIRDPGTLLAGSVFQRVRDLTGTDRHWLTVAVRFLVNANYYMQTRTAFLTD